MEAGGEEDGEQLTPGQAGGGQVDGGQAGEAVSHQLGGDHVTVEVSSGQLEVLYHVAPDDLREDGREVSRSERGVTEVNVTDCHHGKLDHLGGNLNHTSSLCREVNYLYNIFPLLNSDKSGETNPKKSILATFDLYSRSE